MEQPNYVLRTNEAVLVAGELSTPMRVVKVGIWIIFAFFVLGSLFFEENLFMEMSWSSRILLIVLLVCYGFRHGKEEDVLSPIELQFFDDYLVLYYPKRYFGRNKLRMRYEKMQYSDITKCAYLSESKRIHFYGRASVTWYQYDKDGNLPDKPNYDRIAEETICYFRTHLTPEVDFVQEIESHSPIRVTIEER